MCVTGNYAGFTVHHVFIILVKDSDMTVVKVYENVSKG